ncbi:MAG: DoxX family protein [Gordonia sp. (in: high G+C Gram-positive bacteria)]|uniref:DoxX family protein n=1 Tax=Gordonia TaxID=2053 RepID=UPI003264AD1D
MLTKVANASPGVVSAFRVVVGFLLLCHGTSTLFAWPAAPYGGQTAAVGAWPSWWAAVIQLVAGAALIIGLGTRPAAFIASGSMAVAYFWKHQPAALLPIANDGDSAALYAWSLLLLVFLGAGPWGLDALVRRRRGRDAAAQGTAAQTSLGADVQSA